MTRHWTEAELATLRREYTAGGTKHAAAALGRTPSAIKNMARKLKLAPPKPRQAWTPADDAIIKRIYPGLGAGPLVKPLGRTINSIRQRAGIIGVRYQPSPDTRASARAAAGRRAAPYLPAATAAVLRSRANSRVHPVWAGLTDHWRPRP